jgi:hypothetical protein
MLLHTRSVVVASAAIAAVIALAAPLNAQRGRGGQSGRTSGQQGGSERAGQVQRPSAPPQRQAQVQRQAPPQSRSAPRPQADAPRGYNPPRPAPYVNHGRPGYEVRRPVFVQPYYAFRPRVSLGFGIHIGYDVAYPFRYYDPFAFYNFRIGVVPGYGPAYRSYDLRNNPYARRVGGLSFDIEPRDAAVFIDGEYVGYAADFCSGQMPLTLAAGRHRVDLRADGLRPLAFDITIVAGQVIPYRGTLFYGR